MMPSPRSQITCDEAQPLLPLITDGSLGQSDDPMLFEHLARCNDCQEALVRHDLIGIALDHGRKSGASGKKRLVFRLPIPVAIAASLLFALSVWAVVQHRVSGAADTQAHPEVTRVIQKDGKSLYEIQQGGTLQIVDPETLDRPSGINDNRDVQPASLKRRSPP